MKRLDFSKDKEFNETRQKMEELLQKMGAERITWADVVKTSGLLRTSGIDISLEKIEYVPDDKTLEYKGRKVVVYIRDKHVKPAVDIDKLVDPEDLYKFHVANCSKLQDMKEESNFKRYLVATRTDGQFIVNFLVRGRTRKKVKRKLYVCKLCLSLLNYEEYNSKNNSQRNKIRNEFDLNEFFEKYPSKIIDAPTGSDVTARVNEYPPDWEQISRQYREKVEWKCEKCNIDLSEKKNFLHTHHRNGVKYCNNEKNLRALCIGCHAEEPQHQHLKSEQEYKDFQRWKNRT